MKELKQSIVRIIWEPRNQRQKGVKLHKDASKEAQVPQKIEKVQHPRLEPEGLVQDWVYCTYDPQNSHHNPLMLRNSKMVQLEMLNKPPKVGMDLIKIYSCEK